MRRRKLGAWLKKEGKAATKKGEKSSMRGGMRKRGRNGRYKEGIEWLERYKIGNHVHSIIHERYNPHSFTMYALYSILS